MPAVRLFIGNLPYNATEDDIRAHFAQVGPPTQIVRPLDRETGRARGFAFVEYGERPLAEEAPEEVRHAPGRDEGVEDARAVAEEPGREDLARVAEHARDEGAAGDQRRAQAEGAVPHRVLGVRQRVLRLRAGARVSTPFPWTIVGAAAMGFGARALIRGAWIAGAVLLGIVVLKLLLVDMRFLGTLSGIVSVLGVGVLFVALGYFAPMPRDDAVETAS